MVALIVCGGFMFVFLFVYILLFSTLCPSSVAITMIGVARSAVSIVVFPDHTYWLFKNDIKYHMAYTTRNLAMYIQS